MSETTIQEVQQAEIIVTGGRVIDPKTGFDALADIAVQDGQIAAVRALSEGGLAEWKTANRLDARGKIVSPGFIDLHTHVYEWVTNFGVHADEAGVGVGATTIVDQGSSGAWTFGGFNAYIVKNAKTDVRAFVSINVAGALMGGTKGDILHNPSMTDIDAVVGLIAANPHVIRGIKCHGESGGISNWGTTVLEHASAAGVAAAVPLYVHTGELFPVKEASRPEPRSVLPQVLPLLKAGDVLAHIYSSMPDGIVGEEDSVPKHVFEARDMGVNFDIGYGINFSYRIARTLMEAGIYPDTISSDIHGDFNSYHDLAKLDYSLPGAMSRLWALGMPIEEVIRAVTAKPASILGIQGIGTLEPGTVADITICDVRYEPWVFSDGRGRTITADRRLIPWRTFRRGEAYTPSFRMLPDLLTADEISRSEKQSA